MSDLELAMLRAEVDRLSRAHDHVVLRLQELADVHRHTVKAAREVLGLIDRMDEGKLPPSAQTALNRLSEFVPEPLEGRQ